MSKSAKRRARARQRRQTSARAAVALPLGPKRAATRPKGAPPKKRPAARVPEPEERTGRDAIHSVMRATGLPNVTAIARRDLVALFVSPIGWVVGGIFTFLVSAFGFYIPVLAGQQATMLGVFGVITNFLMVVLVPLLTMRLFAEERSQGTLELLLTSPVRDWELTVGKWLGAFTFYLSMLAITLAYVAILRFYASKLDLGLIGATYIGLALVGGAAVAIGALASSLTRNQIIAFFVAMGALLVIWYAGYVIGYFTAPPANLLFAYVGGFNRFQSFSLGQAALKDIVFFLTVTFAALFLTTRVLGARRWR